jgi:hypothetical protein
VEEETLEAEAAEDSELDDNGADEGDEKETRK